MGQKRRPSEQMQQNLLLDGLVGDGEHTRRDGEAERTRGPQIDHQLELGRLQNR
jgi:hypothetical protein